MEAICCKLIDKILFPTTISLCSLVVAGFIYGMATGNWEPFERAIAIFYGFFNWIGETIKNLLRFLQKKISGAIKLYIAQCPDNPEEKDEKNLELYN